jgi:hypothetical protein
LYTHWLPGSLVEKKLPQKKGKGAGKTNWQALSIARLGAMVTFGSPQQ